MINNRNSSIDTISGMLIIIMMLGHFNLITKEPYSLGNVFSFYMVWFFFKSGMFHIFEKTSKIIRKQFKKLIIPYIFFSILGLIIDFHKCFLDDLNCFEIIRGWLHSILLFGFPWSNIPLWFLLTLYLVKVISSYSNLKVSSGIIYIIFFFIIAIIHNKYCGDKLYYIGNVSLGVIFYILGYRFRFIQYKLSVFIISLFVYIFLFLKYPNCLDAYNNSSIYGNYILALIQSFSGIIIINNIFMYLNLSNSYLSYISNNAMIFIVIHVPIALFIRDVLNKLTYLPILYIHLLETIISFIIIYSLLHFYGESKYFNFILGKSYEKK